MYFRLLKGMIMSVIITGVVSVRIIILGVERVVSYVGWEGGKRVIKWSYYFWYVLGIFIVILCCL